VSETDLRIFAGLVQHVLNEVGALQNLTFFV